MLVSVITSLVTDTACGFPLYVTSFPFVKSVASNSPATTSNTNIIASGAVKFSFIAVTVTYTDGTRILSRAVPPCYNECVFFMFRL